jgi:hypothetical protein
MALSATYSVNDVKAQLETYDFYDYESDSLFVEAIDLALSEAMNNYLLPIIGWSAYGDIRDLDRNLFDDSTVDTTDEDKTVTMDSTANLVVDMYVNGVGIPVGSQVDSVTDSTTFELTNAATADGTNITCTFNRLTDAQYSVYRAEVNYACYSFYSYHARQKMFVKAGESESRTQGGVNTSASGITGPQMAAAEYLKRANIMLVAGGYNAVTSIKRGDSFFY